MTVLLGDKRRFAAEVGEWDHGLCRVDLWAAGQWLTCDDNMAYVQQFRRAVLNTAAWLRSGHGSPSPFVGLSSEAAHRRLMVLADDDELRSRFQVLNWGPTTDNVIAHLFRDGERLLLTAQFWREDHLLKHPEHADEVFTAEIPAVEFIGILEDLAASVANQGRPRPT